MKLKYVKRLSLAFGLVCSQWTMACKGEPSIAQLRNGDRIIARTQNGLRLEGKHAVPVVIKVELMGKSKVPLKIVGQATGFKDSRSLLERISNEVPQYETFLIPNTLELIPESNTEDETRYKMKFRDGSEILDVELLFEGGSQRGGCGGGKARIEKP